MAKAYVTEDNVALWTSRAIEKFFRDAGKQCLPIALSRFTERRIPADHFYRIEYPAKVFGIQYKALYQPDPGYWRLDRPQHQRLSKTWWISYGLSEPQEDRDHE